MELYFPFQLYATLNYDLISFVSDFVNVIVAAAVQNIKTFLLATRPKELTSGGNGGGDINCFALRINKF